MTSTRPYLLRALYEWIVDNESTPHIVVDAEMPNVHVPTEYIKDGQIVLNISPRAVKDLHITNDIVEFTAHFSGAPHNIYAPMRAIIAIYARENGRGIVFDEELEGDDGDGTPPDELKPDSNGTPQKRGKPHLTIVK